MSVALHSLRKHYVTYKLWETPTLISRHQCTRGRGVTQAVYGPAGDVKLHQFGELMALEEVWYTRIMN